MKYCPYRLIEDYSLLRGRYFASEEQFFIFADGSPVLPQNMRHCLRLTVQRAGFRTSLYTVHGM